jgi:hypothetical protein
MFHHSAGHDVVGLEYGLASRNTTTVFSKIFVSGFSNNKLTSSPTFANDLSNIFSSDVICFYNSICSFSKVSFICIQSEFRRSSVSCINSVFSLSFRFYSFESLTDVVLLFFSNDDVGFRQKPTSLQNLSSIRLMQTIQGISRWYGYMVYHFDFVLLKSSQHRCSVVVCRYQCYSSCGYWLFYKSDEAVTFLLNEYKHARTLNP